MKTRRTFRIYRDLRRSTGIALAACLLLRALIPAGYMPGNLLAGEFMVLCPQGLPAEQVTLLHAGHGEPGPPSVDADQSCPIGNALLTAAPAPDAARPTTRSRQNAAGIALAESPPRIFHLAGYQSRAPPIRLTIA